MFSVVADPDYYAGDHSSVGPQFIFKHFSKFFFFLVKLTISSQMNAAVTALEKMDVDKDGKVSYPEYLLALKFKSS